MDDPDSGRAIRDRGGKRIMYSRIGVSKALLDVEQQNKFLRWTSLQPSSFSSAALP